MKKEEMIEALYSVAKENGYFDGNSRDEDIFYTDCGTEIDEYFLEPEESEKYIVEQVDQRGSEGDGAEMFLVFKITNKETNEIGYIEYSGRYSSWSDSEYYKCYAVQPKEVMVIEYVKVQE